jgi:hypothetical protein
MFPLFSSEMPSNADELERLLNESLGRLFTGVANPVAVTDKTFPNLAAIRIKLDGARLRGNPQRPPRAVGETSPAIAADEMQIDARDVSIGPAAANLRLRASGLEFNQSKDADGEIVLLLHRAASGELEVSADKTAIEEAVATVAKSEAGKHGVAIDQVNLTVRSRSERSVDAEVQLRAKKMFFTTTVRIAAKLDLDDAMNARLSALSCDGEGAIGALACGALQPHLEKLNGRSFSLMALPLGEVRLRDVRIAAGDQIRVIAQFGA